MGNIALDNIVITTAANRRVNVDDDTSCYASAAAPCNMCFCDIVLMLLRLRLFCRL
jgi:hypothetical protein